MRQLLRFRSAARVLTASVLLAVLTASALGQSPAAVRAWEEKMVIPTYGLGPAEKSPIFFTHESYQGAQKRIYPYALQDHLTFVKEDKSYKALNLENEYIRITVLPEIGGRLFAATDKTNNYDFFYRQHVIKPALIGMLGAWISGGIEWCAFHHHRNTTFMPIDSTITQEPDGGRTIWFGEIERRHRMKWLIGLTLRPGKSYIEATVQFSNRTPQPNSMLYWANVAVHVNDEYQVIFPPSVDVATYHSKIDFTTWPIAKGRYRGIDYSGKDISWWKNSSESNSFFAWNLQEDFMGGYDHGRRAGVVHVGDHHIVSGAKLWEWGTGPYGRMWDRILTDTDGPYAELMVGAWSDNQPDYSWIKPYEMRVHKQYWYPIREIGGFKNANLNGALNLDVRSNGKTFIGFHPTSAIRNAKVLLQANGRTVFEESLDVAPEKPFTRDLDTPQGVRPTDLRAAVVSSDGKELIAYQPVERKPVDQLPKPVQPPPPPAQIKSNEELYLAGMRIEQIHNPTVDPLDYYREAVRRDPGDSRCNTMLGINANKRGLYADAEQYLRKAVERISAEYTRPINAEAYYQLGLAQRAQGELDEATDSFHRATWDQAFRSAGYHQLAELSCRRADYAKALEQIDQSLSANALDNKAMGLKSTILRKLGRVDDARMVLRQALSRDPLDFLAINESHLIALSLGESSAQQILSDLREKMRDDVQSYLELAADYMNCGLWDEAAAVLQRPIDTKIAFASTYPMLHYYLGYISEQKGDSAAASAHYARANKMPADYCFPFRLESLDVLNTAIRSNSTDARAWYYLGNLLYDIQPQRAIAAWERARELDDRFAMVHRNLGFAYRRATNQMDRAIESYEKAVALDGSSARAILELDSLYEAANVSPDRRVALMDQNAATVKSRKETLLRQIMVWVLVGRVDEALDALSKTFFYVREGGDEIRDVYVDACLLKGLACMKAKKYAEALSFFQKASEYPENLSVGRMRFDRRAFQVAWCTASAHEALGQTDKAREAFARGARAGFGGGDARFYRALCMTNLGQDQQASALFDELVNDGSKGLKADEGADFFAKFGERDTRQARLAEAHYTIGLGLLGKKQLDRARGEFEQAVKLNASHVWARYRLAELARR